MTKEAISDAIELLVDVIEPLMLLAICVELDSNVGVLVRLLKFREPVKEVASIDVSTLKYASDPDDPLVMSFFQFGIFTFYYGWLLSEPTSVSGR